MRNDTHSLPKENQFMADRLNRTDAASRHLLSIDMDDLIIANADFFNESLSPSYRTNIDNEVMTTLDTLDECETKATFFVSAQYSRRHDQLLREIVERGHIIASHGFRHRNIAAMPLTEFQDDLCESLDVLSKYQSTIIGYRPPAFSMPYDHEHLGVLQKHGIRYVSSGTAVARSNAPRWNRPAEVSEGLLHVPISTVYFGSRLNYPIGYGVTSRLMPKCAYLLTLRRWLDAESYFHFYCHSFEVGGLSKVAVPFKRRLSRITTMIYMMRCENSRQIFREIFCACRFAPIETHLFNY